MSIYALVDPTTHIVRYVGRTCQLLTRFRSHSRGECKYTRDWVLSLPEKPVLVVLENVTGTGNELIRDSNASETKWIKRFRRTVINTKLRDNGPKVWDALVNVKDANDARA